MAFQHRYIKYTSVKIQIIDDRLLSDVTRIKEGHFLDNKEYNMPKGS